MKTARFAYFTMMAAALATSVICGRLIAEWQAFTCLILAWFPILSLQVKFSHWRPWWLESTEQPDASPCLILALIVEAATISAAAYVGGWIALGIRFLGMLTQLGQLGKYEQEATPAPNDRSRQPDRSLPRRSDGSPLR